MKQNLEQEVLGIGAMVVLPKEISHKPKFKFKHYIRKIFRTSYSSSNTKKYDM